MTATFSIVRDGEVYVFVRGRLVHKRWLSLGYSATFYGSGPPRLSVWAKS